MPSTVRTTTSGVIPRKPLEILAEPIELRCTSCYHWYNPVPNEAEDIKLPRSKPFLNRWARHLVRDHCPTCRQEMVGLALIESKDVIINNHGDELKASTLMKEAVALQQKLRRRAVARDVKLYQGLIDTGADLPPLLEDISSSTDNDDHPRFLLSRQQERALFREFQRRGAFDYPGMGEGFRRELGGTVSDEEKYRQIKSQGCKWDIYKGWVSERGKKMTFKEPEKKNKSGRRQPDTTTKRWGSNIRVSGRRLPPRLDRSIPRLAMIEEAEEEDQAEVAALITAFNDTSISSTALEIKRETPPNATQSSPEIHFARLPSGILHTFEAAALRKPPIPHQLQSLGGTIERVNKGGLTSRLRRKALLNDFQKKDKSGVVRKIVRRIRR